MRGTVQWHPLQVAQRELGPPCQDLARSDVAPQDRQHFQIDELGSTELLAGQPVPDAESIVLIVGQGNDQDACVNDEHGPSAPQRRHRRG